jgi:hypothetical protein
VCQAPSQQRGWLACAQGRTYTAASCANAVAAHGWMQGASLRDARVFELF